jgi:two-component system sensor histidine kinase/response regulator
VWPIQSSTERKITAGLALALTLLLVIGGFSYHSTRVFMEEGAWVAHTYRVINKLGEVLADLREAETSQRGYIITGDQSYLKACQSALIEVRQDLHDVRKLTGDNPSQQWRLDALEPLIAARFAQPRQAIDVENEGRHKAGPTLGRYGLEAEQMADIRKTIAEMQDEERRLLNNRRTRTQTHAQRIIFIISLGSVLAFALVGLASFIIHRDITERKRVEELLRKAHDELEARVQDRTAELTKATETLRAEIAERQRIQEELVLERNLFHALMENIPGTVYFEDTACRFVRINKAQANLLGLKDPKEAIGKTDFDFFPAEAAQEFYASEQKLLQSGQPMIDHIQKVVKPDGQVQWFSATEVPIFDAQGEIVGLVGISRDITERKAAEMEMRQAKQAAEAASQAKSEFLANMSHEIRTPLNGIIGMTELALDTELTPEQRQYLEMVKSSSDSLLTVINDILDFSRIEAGMLDLDPIEFNLRDNLDDTLKTLALRAHQKGLELACNVEPGVPKALVGDPGRLRQIIVNLVGNAIKFTQAGEVVVEVGAESREPGAGWLHFAVRDTGIGIAAEKQKLIFDAFTQADGSTTRHYGGTGLGLSISSRLIEMMQGRIWVESEAGKGSTFHFTARFGEAKGAWKAPPAAAEAHPQLEDLSVLVVDDNATNRRFLEELLTSWRMKPALADSAQAAILALERNLESENPFHLILTDAHMPEMDGFTLAERIKHHPRLAGATIMMLTSGGQRGDAARCRELGVAAYLTKPIGQSELLNAILQVLGAGLHKTELAPLVTRHSLRETRQGLRILLVEDNLVNQRLATRLLEKRGYTVVVASTGREALASLAKQTFDLALMDVQMPDMDGFEATSAIREREKVIGKHLPIVAMTAHAMVGDRERCLAAGMDGYVSKPIKAQALFDAIKALVPGSSEAGAEDLTTSR